MDLKESPEDSIITTTINQLATNNRKLRSVPLFIHMNNGSRHVAGDVSTPQQEARQLSTAASPQALPPRVQKSVQSLAALLEEAAAISQ